jgi:hypothetical protein
MKTARLLAIIVTCALLPACALAVGPDETGPPGPALVGDRPDFTESGVAVPVGRPQLETGYTLVAGPDATEHTVGELLLRVGVSERAELRLGAGSLSSFDPDTGEGASGYGDVSVGAKLELPAGTLADDLALLLSTGVPVGSRAYEVEWGLSAVLAAGRQLGALGLGANLGYATLGGDEDQWLGSLVLGAPLGGPTGAFAEVYGIVGPDQGPQWVADAGITWLLTPDLQLDLRVERPLHAGGTLGLGAGLVARW